MINLLIADDHPVIRAGLRAILEQYTDLRIAAEAETGERAVDLATSQDVDVILMDLNLGAGISGVEATRQIVQANPASRILILTNIENETNIVSAIEAGAVGYVLKDSEPDTLADAVRRTMQGEGILAPSVTRTLLNYSRRPLAQRLTPREQQILRLVAAGRSNRSVAAELHIEEATVKAHLTRVFTKLGVSSRTAAIAAAQKAGLI
jgi:DNA-binding NarL/FixJ family response regulator